MAEHNQITDPLIHEPKGISGATANQVYLSDGSGGGSWVDFVVPEVSLPTVEVDIVGPTGFTIGVTAGDLRLDASYTGIIDNYNLVAANTNEFTVDGVTGEIIFPEDGLYYTYVWMSVLDSIGNNVLGFKGSINGVYNASGSPVAARKTRDANNIVLAAAGSLTARLAGDALNIGIAAETSGNVTVLDSVISVYKVRNL